jgi:predicted transport protein
LGQRQGQLPPPRGPRFDELRRRVQNLDAGVYEEVRKQYIAYKGAS